MKIYLIIFLLSFFGYTFTAYERYAYDIKYSEEYIVDPSQFGRRIPANIYLHFLVEIEKDYDIYTRVSYLLDEDIGFQIHICKYSSKPTHEQIKEDDQKSKCLPDILPSDDHYYEGKYNRYLYNLSVGGEIKYISVNIFLLYPITYFSLIVGPQEKKYKLYDISYKKEFKLNDEDLSDVRNNFLFRLKSETEDNGIIQLKINKEAYPEKEMFVSLSGYESEPNTVQKLEKNEIARKDLLLESKTTITNYSTYEFLIKKIENAKYLGIRVLIDKNITFFSVYVGKKENENENENDKSEEEQPEENRNSNNEEDSHNFSTEIPLSIPFIILILILYTIAILLIFYFILRKCIYKKGNKYLSNEIDQNFVIQPEQ